MDMRLYKHIETTPGILAGQVRIKACRLSVATLLEDMAFGADANKLLES